MNLMVSSDSNMYNCALLGTGRQATRLAEAIALAGGRVVGLYSRVAENGEHFAKAMGLSSVAISDDLNSILALKEIDAVVIATPDFLHYEHTKKSLLAGKHVFLEKPLATNFEQGLELLNLAKDKGLVLAVDYHLRWNPALNHLKHLCEEGYFGNIQKIRINWGWKPNKTDDWRNQDNPWWVLSLLGTHCVDLVLGIFQPVLGKIESFRGEKSNSIYNQKNEDHIKLAFSFISGPIIEIECTLEQDIPLALEISSDKGTFVFDKLVGQEQKIEVSGLLKTFEYKNPWAQAFENFIDAIENRCAFEVRPEFALENIGYLLDIKHVKGF